MAWTFVPALRHLSKAPILIVRGFADLKRERTLAVANFTVDIWQQRSFDDFTPSLTIDIIVAPAGKLLFENAIHSSPVSILGRNGSIMTPACGTNGPEDKTRPTMGSR